MEQSCAAKQRPGEPPEIRANDTGTYQPEKYNDNPRGWQNSWRSSLNHYGAACTGFCRELSNRLWNQAGKKKCFTFSLFFINDQYCIISCNGTKSPTTRVCQCE